MRNDSVVEGLQGSPDGLVHVEISVGAEPPAEMDIRLRLGPLAIAQEDFLVLTRVDWIIRFIDALRRS